MPNPEVRYFTQGDAGEKGPYELEMLRESVRAGRLSRDAMVRPEHGDEARPLSEILATPRRPARRPRRRRRAERGAGVRAEAAPNDATGGSYLLGFLAGAVGGVILILLVLRRARPQTRKGLLWGFALQVLVLVLGNLLD